MSPELYFTVTLDRAHGGHRRLPAGGDGDGRARRPADRRAGGDAADQRRADLHLPRASITARISSAQSAIGSLVGNAINVMFALTYALLAQKRSLAVSLSGAFAVVARR